MNINWKKSKKLQVILLFGPTGVGKTELLTTVFTNKFHNKLTRNKKLTEKQKQAQSNYPVLGKTKFEVISADSMQVYRGLDIGSAKPSAETIKCIPHHLLDIKEPWEQFHVGEFFQQANELSRQIIARGNIPIISGGTAYYFKHFLFGLPKTPPPSDHQVRLNLQKRVKREGNDSLYQELVINDPITAQRIHPHDTYRIVRALEVLYGTGRPLSDYHVPNSIRISLDPLVIGLYRKKEELVKRIHQRTENMFNYGLAQEVKNLMRSGCIAEHPGMRGIGYREFFALHYNWELTLEDIKEEISKNSLKYAKRQLTFFKQLPCTHWMHPEDSSINDLVDTFLAAIV